MSAIPVFVRGGSVIPRWPVQQYVGELENPPVTLDVWWAPDSTVESELYEDAGDGLAHRIGDYLLHRFIYSSSARELSLRHRQEGAATRPRDTFELALHALPHTATPVVMVDGIAVQGEFDKKRIFRVQLSAAFRELSLKF